MGKPEQDKWKEYILADIAREIGKIDRQIAATKSAWDAVSQAQKTLEVVETLLLRMSDIARKAKAERATTEMVDEFEACKTLVAEYSSKAAFGDVNLIWGDIEDIRAEVERMINTPLT